METERTQREVFFLLSGFESFRPEEITRAADNGKKTHFRSPVLGAPRAATRQRQQKKRGLPFKCGNCWANVHAHDSMC